MAEEAGLGGIIKKIEKTSLEKFKNQNKMLKKFGKPGLKVYRAVRKRGISIGELVEKTGLGADQILEVLLFMKEKGMAETVGEIEPEKEEVPETEGPMGIGEGEEEEERKARPAPPTVAPEEEVSPERRKKQVEIEEEGLLAPGSETEEEEAPLPEEEFGIVPEEEEPAPEEEPVLEEGGIEPLGLENEEEEPEGEEKSVPAEEEEPAPEEEPVLEEGGIEPLGLENEEEEPEGEEEPAPEEEEPPLEDEVGDEIAPRTRRDNEKEENEGEEEDDDDIFLTPGERKIKAQYGQVGIDVYNLIDGQRTAEEIMKDTGITETTLIEMLDFMEKNGIIKLEHPGTRKPRAPSAAAGAPPPQVKEVGFAPMVDEQVTPDKPLGGEIGKEFTLGVPSKTKGNIFKEMQMKANLMIKFKQAGVKAFELVDGSRDIVEIALKTGVPLYTVYNVMEYLQKEGVVKVEPITREEIRRKYGDDGYSVYKKYGREGVMLYQLIGKDLDLREMANLTSEDKKRVVEIFMFIHRLLGIELPIDEDVLLERIEQPEPSKK